MRLTGNSGQLDVSHEKTIVWQSASGEADGRSRSISIPVTKRWVGPEGGAVTVHLLADGADTGRALSLDRAGNWTGSFNDLPRYRDGEEIVYGIAEDPVDGYASEVSGDASSGFTVTNTKDGMPGGPSPRSSRGSSTLPRTGDRSVAVSLVAAAFASLVAVFVIRRKAAGEPGA